MRKLIFICLMLYSGLTFGQAGVTIPGNAAPRHSENNVFVFGSQWQYSGGSFHLYKTVDSLDLRYPLLSGSYTNPSWITSLPFSKLTATPTTIAGYGIADPIVLTSGSYSNPAWITALAQSKITYTGTNLQYLRGDGAFATFPTTIGSFTNDLSALTGGTGIASGGTYNGSVARTFTIDQSFAPTWTGKHIWNFSQVSSGGISIPEQHQLTATLGASFDQLYATDYNNTTGDGAFSSGTTALVRFRGSMTHASGTNHSGVSIAPTVVSTGTAGGQALLLAPFLSTNTGSNTYYLIRGVTSSAANALGTLTNAFTVSTTGVINSASLTASTALVSDASKNVVSSAVTATELNLLSGKTSLVTNVTSANSDISVATGTTTPALTFNRSLALLTPVNTYSTSATPSIVALGISGIGATASIVGNNQDGTITLNTGTGLSGSGSFATVTMSASFSYPNGSAAVLTPANGNAASLTGIWINTSTAQFQLNSTASTVLAPSTTYIWNYHNGGY